MTHNRPYAALEERGKRQKDGKRKGKRERRWKVGGENGREVVCARVYMIGSVIYM